MAHRDSSGKLRVSPNEMATGSTQKGPNKQKGERGGNLRPYGKFNFETKKRFLELVAKEGPHITRHCLTVGISPACELHHRKTDEEYGAAFGDAKELFRIKVEQELIRRAMEGTNRPVFYQGMKVGEITEFSDQLLLALMKRYDPAYRDKQQMDVNIGGGVLVVGQTAQSVEEWNAEHGGNGTEEAPKEIPHKERSGDS